MNKELYACNAGNKKGKLIVAGILAATAAIGVAAALLHHFMAKDEF